MLVWIERDEHDLFYRVKDKLLEEFKKIGVNSQIFLVAKYFSLSEFKSMFDQINDNELEGLIIDFILGAPQWHMKPTAIDALTDHQNINYILRRLGNRFFDILKKHSTERYTISQIISNIEKFVPQKLKDEIRNIYG